MSYCTFGLRKELSGFGEVLQDMKGAAAMPSRCVSRHTRGRERCRHPSCGVTVASRSPGRRVQLPIRRSSQKVCLLVEVPTKLERITRSMCLRPWKTRRTFASAGSDRWYHLPASKPRTRSAWALAREQPQPVYVVLVGVRLCERSRG